ncbi:hypothetical protein MMPV_006178 [Pyropia vietnamensis]
MPPLLPCYEDLVADLLATDGLAVVGRGLGVHAIAHALLTALAPPPPRLVLLLNAPAAVVNRSLLPLFAAARSPDVVTPRLVNSATPARDRRAVYAAGGILAVSPTVLNADLLRGDLPVAAVAAVVVLAADRVAEGGVDAFSLRLLRQRNRAFGIKGLAEDASGMARGFHTAERVLRSLFMTRLFLVPRFTISVRAVLEAHPPEVVTLTVGLGGLAMRLRAALVRCMALTGEELRRAAPPAVDLPPLPPLRRGGVGAAAATAADPIEDDGSKDDPAAVAATIAFAGSMHAASRRLFAALWHALPAKTRQLVSDLSGLHTLLGALTRLSAVHWAAALGSAAASDGGRSYWLVTREGEAVFRLARARVYALRRGGGANGAAGVLAGQATPVRKGVGGVSGLNGQRTLPLGVPRRPTPLGPSPPKRPRPVGGNSGGGGVGDSVEPAPPAPPPTVVTPTLEANPKWSTLNAVLFEIASTLGEGGRSLAAVDDGGAAAEAPAAPPPGLHSAPPTPTVGNDSGGVAEVVLLDSDDDGGGREGADDTPRAVDATPRRGARGRGRKPGGSVAAAGGGVATGPATPRRSGRKRRAAAETASTPRSGSAPSSPPRAPAFPPPSSVGDSVPEAPSVDVAAAAAAAASPTVFVGVRDEQAMVQVAAVLTLGATSYLQRQLLRLGPGALGLHFRRRRRRRRWRHRTAAVGGGNWGTRAPVVSTPVAAAAVVPSTSAAAASTAVVGSATDQSTLTQMDTRGGGAEVAAATAGASPPPSPSAEDADEDGGELDGLDLLLGAGTTQPGVDEGDSGSDGEGRMSSGGGGWGDVDGAEGEGGVESDPEVAAYAASQRAPDDDASPAKPVRTASGGGVGGTPPPSVPGAVSGALGASSPLPPSGDHSVAAPSGRGRKRGVASLVANSRDAARAEAAFARVQAAAKATAAAALAAATADFDAYFGPVLGQVPSVPLRWWPPTSSAATTTAAGVPVAAARGAAASAAATAAAAGDDQQPTLTQMGMATGAAATPAGNGPPPVRVAPLELVLRPQRAPSGATSALLSALSPSFVVLYDPELSLVREVEVLAAERAAGHGSGASAVTAVNAGAHGEGAPLDTRAASAVRDAADGNASPPRGYSSSPPPVVVPPLRVYLIRYDRGIDDERYAAAAAQEASAFETLIRQRARMTTHAGQDGRVDAAAVAASVAAVLDAEDPAAGGGGNRRDARRRSTATTEGAPAVLTSDAARRGRVIVDARELRSGLPSALDEAGLAVVPATLAVGDYVVSPRLAVERKSPSDLASSLASGRLATQAAALIRHYAVPSLLLHLGGNTAGAGSGSGTGSSGRAHYSLSPSYSDIPAELSPTHILSRLALLVLNFPQLRLLWASSSRDAAVLLAALKAAEEGEPDEAVAVALGGIGAVAPLPGVEAADAVGPLDGDEWSRDGGDGGSSLDAEAMLGALPGVDSGNASRVMRSVGSVAELVGLSRTRMAEVLGSTAAATALWSFVHQVPPPDMVPVP